MNINISQVANGWIVAIMLPGKGQQAVFYPTFAEVITQLEGVNKQMEDAIAEQDKQPENVVPLDAGGK
jgi:hypothetical protein